MTIEAQVEPKRRSRSPNYPAIPLPAALDRARILYTAEKGHPTPVDTVLRHWGHRPRSGAGLVAIAALLQFGLADDEGRGATRRVRLSDLGLRIIRDDRPDSVERDALIREAALRPPIHHELLEQFEGSLPSDENLRYMLKVDRSFTDTGAHAFIKEFRNTIEFAGLAETEAVSSDANQSAEYGEFESPTADAVAERSARVADYISSIAPRTYDLRRLAEWNRADAARLGAQRSATEGFVRSQTRRGRSIPLPILSTTEWPVLLLPGRITEADWNQMLAILEAMKPGIIAQSVREAPDEDQAPVDLREE